MPRLDIASPRLAFAAFACTLLAGCSKADGDIPPQVARTARLLAAERPFVARLTGSTKWAPCTVAVSALGWTGARCGQYSPTELTGRLADIGANEDRGWSSALMDMLGDGDVNQVDPIADRLEDVVSRNEGSASAHSDLAVAYLALAEKSRDATLLYASLDQIERAAQLAPAADVVVFNHAVVLEGAHLHAQARAAWNAYLVLNPAREWASEAKTHIAALPTTGNTHGHSDWTQRAAVLADPQAAREMVLDSLLPHWTGASTEALRDADLRTMQAIAVVLSASGDSSMLHVVDACRRATPAVTMSARQMVEAIAIQRSGNNEGAVTGLSSSALALRRAGASALAEWAELTLAMVDVYGGRTTEAEGILEPLARGGAAHSDLSLEARARWMLALSLARHGASAGASQSYATAAGLFHVIGERANEVAMVSQQADVLYQLGRDREAIAGHARALAQLTTTPAPGRRAGVLLDLARQSQELGMPYAALAMLREAVANAQLTGRAIDRSEALVRLAQVSLSLHLVDSGRARLAEARVALGSLTDSIARSRMATEIAVAEATLLAGDSAMVAIERLDQVIAYYRSHSLTFGLATYLTRRAQLELAVADTANAEADLASAIATVESYADRPGNPASSRVLTAVRRDAFLELVDIRASRHDTLGAFFAAEHGRGNAIASLPRNSPGVLTLSFIVRPHELIAWGLQDGALRMVRQRISHDSLGVLAARLESALRRSDTASSDLAARHVYDVLVAPFTRQIAANTSLVVVSDDVIDRIPFAMLIDEGGGRLVERIAISHASAVRPAVAARMAKEEIAVVENPAFDSALFPSLSPLTASERETAAIRALQPKARVLMGERAVKAEVVALLQRSSLVHFAGHAVRVARDPEFSHLVLARAPGGFEANALSTHDIRALDLRRLALVILASCGTTQRVSRRDASERGLASAFLDAGAGSVVSGLWEADDERTSELMIALHDELSAGAAPATALRAAQVKMLRGGGHADPARTWSLFRVDQM